MKKNYLQWSRCWAPCLWLPPALPTMLQRLPRLMLRPLSRPTHLPLHRRRLPLLLPLMLLQPLRRLLPHRHRLRRSRLIRPRSAVATLHGC